MWELMERFWDQDPRLRPKVSEVFHVLPSNALNEFRCLYELGVASHEFQFTLGRFYGSSGYQDRIDGLHDANLTEFVDFLDTV